MSNNATPNISSLSLASGTQSHCCWYCGRGEKTLPTKLQKCGRCGLAVYCNRECQGGDWKLHKAKCKRLTEIVVNTDVKNRLRSGALKRRLLTLSEGTVILTIRDPGTYETWLYTYITTIGDMNLPPERAHLEAPFFQCKSLLRVDLEGCTELTSVGTGAFASCSSLTSVVLPYSLTQIGDGAFTECTSLTSVVLPDSITQLGNNAFFDCSSLTSVVLPDSLTNLGGAAFARCSSLTSVVLPDSLTQLGEQAFIMCSSLTSVVLPNSLTQMGKQAFVDCISLTSVVLPDSAELGDDVFEQCDALERKAALAGFDSVEPYLRDRYKRITLRKLFLRLLRKYNKAVNNADGTEAEKHASALAQFPTDNSSPSSSGLFASALAYFATDFTIEHGWYDTDNSSSLDVGLFLQKMSTSGGDGEKGLVGYILKFV